MGALLRLMTGRAPLSRLGLGLLVGLVACQARQERRDTDLPPPVGHYEGRLGAPGQLGPRIALDIRHPTPGHYDAELTAPAAGTLSFVADSLIFSHNQLRLTRPARPGQVLNLTLDGDFWRGALTLDSTKTPTLLVKRGAPAPRTYQVAKVPQPAGPAWLFAPADTGTPGAALALLPDTQTAPAAALWADALAREGVIVLVMPAADSGTVATETPRLRAALRLLRTTAGADTTNVGLWAAGARASGLVQALTVAEGSPKVAFLIVQNLRPAPAAKAALRELKRRKVPLLGLYGGPNAAIGANSLRGAGGGRRGATVRSYRTAGVDLLVAGGLSPRFGPGLPGEVVEWLRGQK